MSTLQVLKAARKLIERPESWTQGSFAATANDGSVDADVSTYSPYANCFCAWGAVRRAASDMGDIMLELPAMHALTKALDRDDGGELPGGHIACWNDMPGRKHADVLALFDRAIEQETNRASMA